MATKTKTLDDLYAQIPLTKEKATAIASYFTTAVQTAKASRRDLEDRWERAIKLYEGKREPKTHPTKDASNIHVPMVATHGSAIHARFMTSVFGQSPLWKVSHRNPSYQDFAETATEYMDWARMNQFPMYTATRDFTFDSIKLGLGIMKVTWLRRRGTELRYDENFKILEEETLVEDRPHVESIPPEYFVWSEGATDIQTCEWICHIRRFSVGEMMRRGKAGEIFNVNDALKSAGVPFEQVESARDETAGELPTRSDQVIMTYELWCRYDANGDGDPEELQIEIEPSGGKILRINPLPFFHRRRPFVIARLEPIEHKIAGLGIADMIGDVNEEVNTVHNQTIDAAKYSNLSMFGVRSGTPAWDATEELYSGKRIPVLQKDDIFPLPLGDFRVSSLNLEGNAHAIAERRTGISDFSVGREPNPSRRGTATGTLAIIQEGNKKFDFQVRDLREALGEAGFMLLSLTDQMNPSGIIQEVLGIDGVKMESIQLSFPRDTPLNRAVSVEVIPSSAAVNRQIQRQDTVQLFQLWNGFAQQGIQLAMMIQQMGIIAPPMLQLLTQFAKGAEVLMADVLQAFENRRKDELIPELEELINEIGSQGAALAAGVQAVGSLIQGAGGAGQGQGALGPGGPPGAGVQGGGPPAQGGAPSMGQGSASGGREAAR